jgi:hypothetical protein
LRILQKQDNFARLVTSGSVGTQVKIQGTSFTGAKTGTITVTTPGGFSIVGLGL